MLESWIDVSILELLMQKMETFIACKLVLAQKKHGFDVDCLFKPFYGTVDGGCLDSIIERVIIFLI